MIRFATKNDIKSLLQIEEESFSKDSFPLSKRAFLYNLKNPIKLLVYEINRKIVGYILNFFHKKSLRIYSIAVLKEYRGKKIGFQLIKKTMTLAKSKNLSYISLEVKLSNQKAIKLYQDIGFEKTKILKEYYHFEDGIKMIYTL